MPEPTCDRVGCIAPYQTHCPLCSRLFCLEHDKLPDGHACLSSIGRERFLYNAVRVIDADEEAAALERFRPLR